MSRESRELSDGRVVELIRFYGETALQRDRFDDEVLTALRELQILRSQNDSDSELLTVLQENPQRWLHMLVPEMRFVRCDLGGVPEGEHGSFEDIRDPARALLLHPRAGSNE